MAIVDVLDFRVTEIKQRVNGCNVQTTGVELEVLQHETDEIKIKVSPHILMPIFGIGVIAPFCLSIASSHVFLKLPLVKIKGHSHYYKNVRIGAPYGRFELVTSPVRKR
jgi:hypothetical protein